MRRQDEIRLLFPSQHASSQKFLLTELDRFAQAFDADEVLDLLRVQSTSPNPDVGRQALVVATQFLPDFVARRYGTAQEQVGLWSEYHVEFGLLEAVSADDQDSVDKGRLRAAALERLWPALETLAYQLDRLPGLVRPTAMMALSLAPGAAELVTPWLLRSARDFSLVWAWARAGGAHRSPGRLLELLDLYGPSEPDLLLAALCLPPEAVVKIARKLAGRIGWRGVANLAQALGRTAGDGCLEALELLTRETAAWGEVYVLRALEAIRQPAGFDLVKRLHARATTEFVVRQAVRAAGGFASQQAIDFCCAQLNKPEGAVTAQALESLVRLRCPRGELADLARRFVRSDHLRTRVNALLAMLPTEARVSEGLEELLRHADPLPRIEAAFCLSYWQTRSSLESLEVMAMSDPHPHVRAQAIKSLSKYQATVSLPVLTRIIETGEPADALLASRVMSRLGGRDSHGLVAFFLREVARHSSPDRKALLVSALAPLSQGQDAHKVEEALFRALQSEAIEVQLAALDGFRVLGGSDLGPVSSRVRALRESKDPRVRASAAVTGFLSGDLALVDRLCDDLRSGSAATVAAAVQAVLDLVTVVRSAVGPRFKALAVALPGRVATPAPVAWEARSTTAALPAVGLEEGEFEITQDTSSRALPEALAAVSPGNRAPAPVPHHSVAGRPRPRVAHPVSSEKSLPRVRGRPKSDLGSAVGQQTYLVARPEQMADLELEVPRIRILRAMRQIAVSVGRNPARAVGLVAGFVLVAVLFWFLAR